MLTLFLTLSLFFGCLVGQCGVIACDANTRGIRCLSPVQSHSNAGHFFAWYTAFAPQNKYLTALRIDGIYLDLPAILIQTPRHHSNGAFQVLGKYWSKLTARTCDLEQHGLSTHHYYTYRGGTGRKQNEHRESPNTPFHS